MAAYKYSYGKCSGLFKNPAEVAGPICMKLKKSKEGLTPESLLNVSRAANAPLHNEFEWDDSIAAEGYRKEQARNIIRHLIIVRTDVKEPIKDRAFVYVGEKKTGYVPLDEALSNDKWRENLMASALRDMKFFVAKYRRLEELSNIIDEMNRILSQKDAV